MITNVWDWVFGRYRYYPAATDNLVQIQIRKPSVDRVEYLWWIISVITNTLSDTGTDLYIQSELGSNAEKFFSQKFGYDTGRALFHP